MKTVVLVFHIIEFVQLADAHPIVGRIAEGVYAACGFSGHGFMQSPAVGRAVAELIVRGETSLDLRPYALERFDAGAVFPEHLVL